MCQCSHSLGKLCLSSRLRNQLFDEFALAHGQFEVRGCLLEDPRSSTARADMVPREAAGPEPIDRERLKHHPRKRAREDQTDPAVPVLYSYQRGIFVEPSLEKTLASYCGLVA